MTLVGRLFQDNRINLKNLKTFFFLCFCGHAMNLLIFIKIINSVCQTDNLIKIKKIIARKNVYSSYKIK